MLPRALPKTSLTGISSRDQESSTTFTSSNDSLTPFHKIRNANLVDPSIWFRPVTVVVKVPPAYFDVSTVYMTEPVSESRMVALRMVMPRTSSSSFEVKDRFILRNPLEVQEEGTIGVGDSGVPEANRVSIYGLQGVNPFRPGSDIDDGHVLNGA